MAWTETCKIDANKQVDHLHKQGMSKRQAIKKLSGESGIPEATLDRWYYPRKKSSVKNDVTLQPDTSSEAKPNETDESVDPKNDISPVPQEDIWYNVAMRLKRLDDYIKKNCKTHADVSNGVKEAIDFYIARIQVSYAQLK